MYQATALVAEPAIFGRYALFDELASGGMATVHLGRVLAGHGFGRTVAIKRLHAHLLKDPEFVTMFMDEARIVAQLRHPNIVPMIDLAEGEEALLLVMEYVHGESLARVMRAVRAAKATVPAPIAATIAHAMLLGLHGAHEARDPSGQLLDVVHRDVSPQNVIVGLDGVARVLDFGIAKAAGRAQVTRQGELKGKLAYMSPEQIRGHVDRRSDVYAAAVVLWEMLVARRFHEGANEVDIVTRTLTGAFTPPSSFVAGVSPALDDIVQRGLSAKSEERFQTAEAMALAIEHEIGLVDASEVGAWLEPLAHEALTQRAAKIAAIERVSASLAAAVPVSVPTITRATPVSLGPPPGAHAADEAPHAMLETRPSSSGVQRVTGGTRTDVGISVDVTARAFQSADPSALRLESPYAFMATAAPTASPPGDSMAAPQTEAPTRRSRQGPLPWPWIIIAVSLVILSLGLWLGRGRPRRAPPRVEPTSAVGTAIQALPGPAVPSSPGPGESLLPGAGGRGEEPSRAEDAPSSELPVAAVASGRAVEPLASATAPPPTPHPRPRARPVLPGAEERGPFADPCQVPYTIDEAGHRRYKLECLGRP